MTSAHWMCSLSGSSICCTVQGDWCCGHGNGGDRDISAPALGDGIHHPVGRQSWAQTVMAQSGQDQWGVYRRVGQPTGRTSFLSWRLGPEVVSRNISPPWSRSYSHSFVRHLSCALWDQQCLAANLGQSAPGACSSSPSSSLYQPRFQSCSSLIWES